MPQSLARVETPRELEKSGYEQPLSRCGLSPGWRTLTAGSEDEPSPSGELACRQALHLSSLGVGTSLVRDKPSRGLLLGLPAEIAPL